MNYLASESDLVLVDRALAAGDIVKRQLSDPESGTVVSTSLRCALRPTCSISEYNMKKPRTALGICPHCYKRGQTLRTCMPRCPALESPDQFRSETQELHDITASDLKYWNNYREDDYIIYKNWIGRIRDVIDEVTIRLNDGSVVVVENADELLQPYWIDGSHSNELHQHFLCAGYLLDRASKECAAEPCYPGQIVETKKGNLRRGRWKFGAYNPNVTPQGIVVDVRTVHIEVAWLKPNESKPYPFQHERPPIMLEVDALEHGEVLLYDHSKQPKARSGDHLSGASYSLDIGFGHYVRFRDVAGAAVKYNGSQQTPGSQNTLSCWEPIPRTNTQGYDMNVFQVTQTQTKVAVQWQDHTVTEEDSISLVPYMNVDDQDVWPGDYVSLQAAEEINKDADTIICHKMGVVQSVNAAERFAQVRWFVDSIASVAITDESLQLQPTKFGHILETEDSTVSLYDIHPYSAHSITRGDMLIVVPDSLAEQMEHSDPAANSDILDAEDGVSWFGEVVDIRIDGRLTVRLGAASQVDDIVLPRGRCSFVATYEPEDGSSGSSEEEPISDDESSGSFDDDHLSDSDMESTTSKRLINLEIEYEGGDRIDNESNDDVWTTEEEDPRGDSMSASSRPELDDSDSIPVLAPPSIASQSSQGLANLEVSNAKLAEDAGASDKATLPAVGSELQLSHYSSKPAQNLVLEDSPPADHHFINESSSTIAPVIRRIMREHRIMNSSLPEGVFVRTWESRLDLLRVLIVGPRDTPYELAPFVFDFHFTNEFPEHPPSAYFHSWTNSKGRINPNLYEDGTICLSLLGTWPGPSWSAKTSTILQVIVSLMGLVLVREPYFSKYIPSPSYLRTIHNMMT